MIKNENIPEGGIDIPGPIDWENTSHSLEYDNDNLTVQLWGRMGPIVDGKRAFRLMTRIRPMVGSEIIHAKLHGYSREEVLAAYGVDESTPIVSDEYSHKLKRLIKRTHIGIALCVMLSAIHIALVIYVRSIINCN